MLSRGHEAKLWSGTCWTVRLGREDLVPPPSDTQPVMPATISGVTPTCAAPFPTSLCSLRALLAVSASSLSPARRAPGKDQVWDWVMRVPTSSGNGGRERHPSPLGICEPPREASTSLSSGWPLSSSWKQFLPAGPTGTESRSLTYQ